MESEKIILQCIGDQLDKSDLVLRWKPKIFFFDLLPGHTSLRHQRGHVDARRSGACTCEAGQSAFCHRAPSGWGGKGLTRQLGFHLIGLHQLAMASTRVTEATLGY